MLYFIISWAIIGLLWMFFSGQAGMFVTNMKDYFAFIFACGPLVWLLLLISLYSNNKEE
jgi:hypothetical protein